MTPRDDEFREIKSALRGDTGEMNEKHDRAALMGVGVSLLVNIAGLAWIGGKFDQRMITAEKDISELKQKFSRDAEQDVQIATISTQLANISTNLGEIKVRLEQKR